MSGWRGIRYTDLKKILHPGGERDGPPNGGRGGFRSRRGCAPHFLFETSKRKCAAPGGKENMFGGSVCAGADLLPPAGDGWLSLAAVRGGNARPLGKPPARGGRRIHPAPIFAAAGRWLMRAAAWANTTTSTTARGVRSEAERTERDAGQIRSCTPTTSAPSATGRQYLPRRRVKRARRSGKIGAGTDTPTPVRTEGHRTGVRSSAFFSSTGRGAFSFWARPKREWGAHPLWEQKPLFYPSSVS